MKNVLITGGTGLIGTHLSELLLRLGYSVSLLSTGKQKSNKLKIYHWDIEKGIIEPEALTNADYIVNLAGASISGEKWTKKRKAEIYSSRVAGTLLLAKKLKELRHDLKAFIGASAVGYYGNGYEQLLTEDAQPGNDFLAQVCRDWEAQSMSLTNQGIRTVVFRTAVVLARNGGALPELAKSMKFGVAVYLGNGKQYFPWIHVEDICRAYVFAIQNKGLNGIYNAVAPDTVTNHDLVLAIKEAKKSVAVMLPVPAFVLKLALGEMSATLLSGARCSSLKLQDAGFEFVFPNLTEALRNVISAMPNKI